MPRTQKAPSEPCAFRAGDRVYTYDGPGTVVDGRGKVHGEQYPQVLLDTTARRLGITNREVREYEKNNFSVTAGYYASSLVFYTDEVERQYAEVLCRDYGLTARWAEDGVWEVTKDIVEWTMQQFTVRCHFCDSWAGNVLEGELYGKHRQLPVCLWHSNMLLKNDWGITAEERAARLKEARKQAISSLEG